MKNGSKEGRRVEYLFLLIAGLASIHAYSFAQWLWKNGNSLGAVGIYVLIIIALSLPLYRIISVN